jgi:hypothetical protein
MDVELGSHGFRFRFRVDFLFAFLLVVIVDVVDKSVLVVFRRASVNETLEVAAVYKVLGLDIGLDQGIEVLHLRDTIKTLAKDKHVRMEENGVHIRLSAPGSNQQLARDPSVMLTDVDGLTVTLTAKCDAGLDSVASTQFGTRRVYLRTYRPR